MQPENKKELATVYLEKIVGVMSEFLEESKGKGGDIYEEIAKRHTMRIDTLLRNYERKFSEYE